MAKASTKSLNLILMLSLLVLVSMAECRFLGAKGTPQCDTVVDVGVESGVTCFDIQQKFQLTAEFFDSINPNLDCDALFMGQWICVDGSAN